MTVVKTAISLDAELLAAVRAEVARGRAASVSAYFAESARLRQEKDSMARFLAEEFGPDGEPTPEAVEKARRELFG